MNKFIVLLLVCLASTNAFPVQSQETKGLVDFIVNTFNLGAVWDEIQGLGSQLGAQFQNVLAQLLFAGQDKWNQAQQLFNTLVYDLTNHIGDASTIVAQTIQQLNQLLSNQGGKRDLSEFFLAEFFLNTLGFGGIWVNIEDVNAGLLGQFAAEITQLIFAGQQVLAQAKPILQQLASDLLNHFPSPTEILQPAVQQLAALLNQGGKRGLADFFLNTLGLGDIWANIQDVGAGLLAQFTAEITQLIFAGQQVLAQAKPILQQLASDLQNHLGNSSTILQNAVQQLAALLNQGGKRATKGLVDFIVNTFNLGAVWDEIQGLGSQLGAQFQNVLAQLLFAGQDKWNQAQQLFNTLVYDLTNHIGDASTIVAQTIQQLNQLLSNQGGK